MAYSPKAQELVMALDDLYYETEQLAYTTIVPPGSEPRLDNAILESRLLHVRNLLDFFEHAPGENDDVLVVHHGFVASRVPLEESYRGRLNKDLAHLTIRVPAEVRWTKTGLLIE